ncbi:MAG: MCP four helix bundle domain-containing protein, partial [Desulfuromonadaceae bacterium]|nr:MCP four helix bundle domain-containing protein [Desulfuromonadaceae bacterium]
MSFYASLKIRNKLLLGFGLMVFIAFATGLFGYSQIYLIQTSDNIMYQNGAKPLEYIGDIATSFQRLRSNLRECILVNKKVDNEYYLKRVKTFHNEIDDTFKKLEATLPDSESKKLFEQMVKARDIYSPHVSWIMELAKSNNDNMAVAYMNSDDVFVAERSEIDAIETLQRYLVNNARNISEANSVTADASAFIMLIMAFGASILAASMAFIITRSVVSPLTVSLEAVQQQEAVARERARLVAAIAAGDLDQKVVFSEPLALKVDQDSEDEASKLLASMVSMSHVQYILDQAFAEMTGFLRHTRDFESRRDRQKNALNDLNKILSGDLSTTLLAENSLSFLAHYLNVGSAVLYLADEKTDLLKIVASYAFVHRKRLNSEIRPGEGLAGQAALEKSMICLNNPPAGYLPIASGLGDGEPASILVIPVLHDSNLVGILEFSSFNPFTDEDIAFLNKAVESIGVAFSVNLARQKVNVLLHKTQIQTEKLRLQQEELQQTNEELEERARILEQQREQIRLKNRDIEAASLELKNKADELERVSAYKSEFLANMSHELRTPLNSMMILSSLLKDNREGNLTPKQVEFASTINGAGRDLLSLINDILDLSKIEAGKLVFNYDEFSISEICQQIQSVFIPVALDKGIDFTITLDQSMPEIINCDSQRTQQILKNLLSNAAKFNSNGSFSLRVYTPENS